MGGKSGGLPSTSFLANAAQHEVIYEDTIEEQGHTIRKRRPTQKVEPLPLLKINTKEV